MKKFIFGIFSAILVLGLMANFLPNFAAARRSSDDDSALNGFVFKNFDAEYILKRDEKGNSYVEVVENLTAVFHYQDTNHGIERAIPLKFDGREVFDRKIEVFRNGQSEPSSIHEVSNDNVIFRIGNANEYVFGEQNYTIKYKLFNVFSKNNSTLILNTNGTQWKQYFGLIHAKLVVDDSAKGYLTGELACYFGAAGEKNSCSSAQKTSENTFEFSKIGALPGQNLTFSVGFKNGAFPQPDFLPQEKIAQFVSFIALAFAAEITLALIAAIWWRIKIYRQNVRRFFVAPQYLPPKISELDILDAGNLQNSNQKLTAAILFFAVNGNIRISDVDEQGVFRKNKLSFEKLNDANLNADMRGLLNAIFLSESVVSDFSKINYSRAQNIFSKIQNVNFSKTDFYVDVEKSRLYNKLTIALGVHIILSFVVFIFAAIFNNAFSTESLVVLGGFMIVAPIAGLAILGIKQLSPKGYEMKNYLRGLKMYIQMSEVKRLKFNQSFETAERFKAEFGGSRVKLYEKLLPWAALFGLEKSWGKVLEAEFSAAKYQPDWMNFSNGFYIGAISASVSDISRKVNSYSSSISSSSGGGGGFSGGGAGGGGGGGW